MLVELSSAYLPANKIFILAIFFINVRGEKWKIIIKTMQIKELENYMKE